MAARILLSVFLFLPLSLGALQAPSGRDLSGERAVNLTGRMIFGLVWGHSEELVFGSASGSHPYLSKLDWDIKPAVLAGASLSLNVQNTFFFNFAAAAALNRHTGEMVDRDWLLAGKYAGQFKQKPWGGSHESVSDIYLKGSFLLDGNMTCRVYGSKRWYASLLGGYKMIHWSWKDQVTSVDYPEGKETPPIGANGIDYAITYWIPYGGLSLGLRNQVLSGSCIITFSPFADASDYDYHKLRNEHFYDYCRDGIYTGISLSLHRRMGKHLSLSFTFEWEAIQETVGDVHHYSGDSSLRRSALGGAGTAYSVIAGSLGLSFAF